MTVSQSQTTAANTLPSSSANLTGSNQAVSNAPCTYRGFTVKETTGTATAAVTIYDNASAASGVILDVITLLANESAREDYAVGIAAYRGIYVQVVSGAVTGAVRSS